MYATNAHQRCTLEGGAGRGGAGRGGAGRGGAGLGMGARLELGRGKR